MIIQTKSGKVEGFLDEQILAFKGIPYAEAPIGDLRYRSPVPVKAWDGVFCAKTYGYKAMQVIDKSPEDPDEGYARAGCSEDCLNLNIWTPCVEGATRPVMVIIHGGGNRMGSNQELIYEGTHFIGDQDIVVVSINFRLGSLGFLYLGELLGDDYATSGNCGVQDQILALQWIQKNIHAFGGDPNRITIQGQSGGGKSVANILVSPKSKGLFQQAIIQSGGIQCIRDKHTATEMTLLTIRYLNLTRETAAELLTMPASTIMDGQEKFASEHLSNHLYGPVADGLILPEDPVQYIKDGRIDIMPILIGNARDELYPQSDAIITKEVMNASLQNHFGKNSSLVEQAYQTCLENLPRNESWGHTLTKYVYGDAEMTLACLLAESGCPVWLYRWDHEGNEKPLHFTDMAYFFNFNDDYHPEGYPQKYRELGRIMHESFLSFIKCGSPLIPELEGWKPYNSNTLGTRMHFKENPHVEINDLSDYDHYFPIFALKL